MISVRWLSFVFVASVLVTGSARAGFFSSPFGSSEICGDVQVADTLADPNAFASSAHCEALCKKTESECKKFVRKVLSCYTDWYTTQAAFENRNCSEYEPASAARDCKSGVSAYLKGIKSKIDAARDTDQKDCESWSGECEAVCNPPVVH